MDPQGGAELPQHGLLFQRSQRSRIRRPDLGRPAGAVGAPRAVQPIQVGTPRPLGATPTGQGVNFALFSSRATRVELCIFDADSGGRFDPGIALIDPYARALSSEAPPRSQVSDAAFDWEDDRPPATPWRDTVIY